MKVDNITNMAFGQKRNMIRDSASPSFMQPLMYAPSVVPPYPGNGKVQTFAVFQASTRPFPLTIAQRTLAPPLKFKFPHTTTNATLSTDPDNCNANEPSNRTHLQYALCNTGRRTCKHAVPPPSPQI